MYLFSILFWTTSFSFTRVHVLFRLITKIFLLLVNLCMLRRKINWYNKKNLKLWMINWWLIINLTIIPWMIQKKLYFVYNCLNCKNYLPIQNFPNMLDRTSSEISSPLICPRAKAASLKSIVQKSRGISSSIDDFNLTRASLVRTSCSYCL